MHVSEQLIASLSAPPATDDRLVWRAGKGGPTVEYTRSFIEQIGREATNCGSRDVVGVLFGMYTPDGFTIHSYRVISIAVPAFDGTVLSLNDRQRLEYLMEQHGSDTALNNLSPLGWLHIRLPGRQGMTAEDCSIHNRHFAGEQQCTLIVSRDSKDLCRGVFYFRDGEGMIAPAAKPLDFSRENIQTQVQAPTTETSMVRRLAGMLVPNRSSSYPGTPSYATGRAAVVLAGLLLIAAMSLAMISQHRSSGDSALAMQLSSHGNDLKIEWNHTSQEVLQASHATLELIERNGESTMVPLSDRSLAEGNVTYRRNTEAVEVRLRLYGSSGILKETVAHYIDPSHASTRARSREKGSVNSRPSSK